MDVKLQAPCRVELVRDLVAFEKLQPEWNEMLRRSSNNSVTLTWDWLWNWWAVYHPGRELCVVAVYDGDGLIGAAPMLTRQRVDRAYRLVPFRRSELLASGEPTADAICSDYIDWIAERGREQEVVQAALGQFLGPLAHEWDELVLPDVPADSATLGQLMRQSTAAGLGHEILARSPSAFIPLPDSFDEFLGGLGSNLRYQIRRGRRDFDSAGGSYRVVSDPSELRSSFQALVELHQARWTQKGQAGAFASAKRREFHDRILPVALANGWLRLGLLSLNGEPIGGIYNFRYAGRNFFYQSGIRTQSNSHIRPGVLMHSYEIEAAITAGDSEYDFLKRGASEYKDHWTRVSRDLVCVRVFRQGLRQHALNAGRWAHRNLGTAKRSLTGRTSSS